MLVPAAPATQLVRLGLLAIVAGVLAWNVFAFPWDRSYDASASARYGQTIREHRRLPGPTDTEVWHNPPLWYVIATAANPVARGVGLAPQRGGQLVSAVSVAATIFLILLLARELFPRSVGVQLAALAVLAGTPVLLRAGALYHPEALATALTTGGLYVLVRALARGRPSLRAGLLCGLLLGLANLTRTWALAALAATLLALALHVAWHRRRETVVMGTAVAMTAGVMLAPWLAYKTIEHGSPLAYSQPIPSQWLDRGRPRSFFVHSSITGVFSTPYSPHFDNKLLPVVYSDWWGDYWRTWRIPSDLHNTPSVLPSQYRRPLVLQNIVGIVPSVAAVVGIVWLLVAALRRRDAALLGLVLSGVFLAASFLGFLIRYPKADGDNIKALYVLNAVPAVTLAAAYVVAWVAGRDRLALLATIVVVVVSLAVSMSFVLLPRP
jgi:hypothetical protein